MAFQQIDMDTWKRAETFLHYTQQVQTMISVTAKVQVTPICTLCKKEGLRFYPVYLYVLAKAVNRQEALRMGWDTQGNPIIWDVVHPSYVVFHETDALLANLMTPYQADFWKFYQSVIHTMQDNEEKRGFSIMEQPPNIFHASNVPWLAYESLHLQVKGMENYLAPVITAGKYDVQGEMPLSIQIHHAAADGYHVSCFFEHVQEEIENLQAYKHI